MARLLKLAGITGIVLGAATIASGIDFRIERTQGGIYAVTIPPSSDWYTAGEILLEKTSTGCQLAEPVRIAEMPCSGGECRSEDLWPWLATGTSTIRTIVGPVEVANERPIVLSEPRFVTEGGRRYAEVDYTLTRDTGATFRWWVDTAFGARVDYSYRQGGVPAQGTIRAALLDPRAVGGVFHLEATAGFGAYLGWGACLTPDQKSVTASVPSPGERWYSLVIHDLMPASNQREVTRRVRAGDTTTTNIKLGTVFSVEVRDARGITESISVSEPVSNVHPKLSWPGRHLWPDRNLVAIHDDGRGNNGFAAVHLGEATAAIAIASESQPVQLRIKVVDPGDLGAWENDWDDRLIEAAHERGIPPHLLKGQAARESGGVEFHRYSFRYEPCTVDWQVLQGKMLGYEAPYNQFLFDAANDGRIFDPDFIARTWRRLYVPVYDAQGNIISRRGLVDNDRDVKAKQIVKAMNEWPLGGGRGQNWIVYDKSCGPYKTWKDAHPTGTVLDWAEQTLDFQAQPGIASSFGLFQVLYTTAIDEGWSVTLPDGTISKNPRYLFDSEASHALSRGGTFMTGSGYDAKKFPGVRAAYQIPDLLSDAFNRMFFRYNGAKKGFSDEYANAIQFEWSPHFVPLSPVTFD